MSTDMFMDAIAILMKMIYMMVITKITIMITITTTTMITAMKEIAAMKIADLMKMYPDKTIIHHLVTSCSIPPPSHSLLEPAISENFNSYDVKQLSSPSF
jgi:hypothetical protein